MELSRQQNAVVIEQMSQSFIEELEQHISSANIRNSIRRERARLNLDEPDSLKDQLLYAVRPSDLLLSKYGAGQYNSGVKSMTSDVQFVLKNRPHEVYQKLLSDQKSAESNT